jgi:hypothetical protein
VRSTRATPLREVPEPTPRGCHLSVRVPGNLYAALVDMAAANERTVAGEVRMLIKQRAEEPGLLSMWEE